MEVPYVRTKIRCAATVARGDRLCKNKAINNSITCAIHAKNKINNIVDTNIHTKGKCIAIVNPEGQLCKKKTINNTTMCAIHIKTKPRLQNKKKFVTFSDANPIPLEERPDSRIKGLTTVCRLQGLEKSAFEQGVCPKSLPWLARSIKETYQRTRCVAERSKACTDRDVPPYFEHDSVAREARKGPL
jgi:hypothetical protein